MNSTSQIVDKPIILLAFADYRTSDSHLRFLGEEEREIKKILELGKEKGHCDYYSIPAANVEEIVRQVEKFGDRLVGFHFAGHSDGHKLMLSDHSKKNKEDAYASGLAPFLQHQAPHLQFVFINGCLSAGQLEHYKSANIPFVIATTNAIDDQLARDFALHFYTKLVDGVTIPEAFDFFEALQNIRSGKSREDVAISTNRHLDFPWKLNKDSATEEDKRWNLPKAAGNPLFFLPLPTDIVPPAQPFKYLQSYQREDALIFPGRSQTIKDLYEIVSPNNPNTGSIILLSGQTGVGKTSFLKAGFLPRIEKKQQVQYIRRTTQKELSIQLLSFFKVDSANHIANVWKQKEKSFEKPLLIIIDQVEEVFTNPIPEVEDELRNFILLLNEIFKPPNSIQGKIILSYRKDYHAEIHDTFKTTFSYKYEYFLLKPLNKEEIIEAVEGSNKYYNLQVEPALGDTIAHELLKIKNSPIAPILQILLSQMWKAINNSAEKKAAPAFTFELYHQLKKNGEFVQSFFAEQIEEVRINHKKAVDRGLVHDILQYHVTTMGSSQSHPFKTTLEQYSSHPKEYIEKLLTDLKEKYLLDFTVSDNSTKRNIERSWLIHDVLAPIVSKSFFSSNRPGQKATKLLTSKVGLDNEGIIFSKRELKLLSKGKLGMRNLTEEEQASVERSQQKQKKANRRKVGLIGIFLLGLSGLLWQFQQLSKEEKINELTIQAKNRINSNPTVALEILKKLLSLDNQNREGLNIRYRILRDHARYESLPVDLEKNKEIHKTAISLDGKLIAANYKGDFSNAIYLYQKNKKDQYIKYKELMGADATQYDIIFSPDGKWILSGGADHRVNLWNVEDKLSRPRIFKLENDTKSQIEEIKLSRNYKWIIARDKSDSISIWPLQKNTDTPLHSFSLPNRKKIHSISIHPEEKRLLVAAEDGIHYYDFSHHPKVVSYLTKASANNVGYSPNGKTVFISKGNQVGVYKLEQDSLIKINSSNNIHPIEDVHFMEDSQRLLFIAGNKGHVWRFESGIDSTYSLIGHTETLKGIIPSNKPDEVYTYGEKGIFKKWRIPHHYPVLEFVADSLETIDALRFTTDSGLIASTINGLTQNQFNNQITKLKRQIIADSTSWIEKMSISNNNYLANYNKGTSQIEVIHSDNINRIKNTLSTGSVNTINFSKDGQRVLIGTSSSKAYALVWNWQKQVPDTLDLHNNNVIGGAFSDDGQYLITLENQGKALLWRLKGEKYHNIDTFKLKITTNAIWDLNFIPKYPKEFSYVDGKKVFLRTFSTNPQQVPNLSHASREIEQLEWDPSGQYFILLFENGHLEAWDKRGILIRKFLYDPNQTVTKITLSPDGNLLAGACEEGIVKIWRNNRPFFIN